jgi:superfamily II DNA/RNA helicase
VISFCLDSLNYLQSAVSDLDIAAELITGGQSFSEREQSINRFLKEGTLLLATDAVMEGFALPQVNDVIHFDLPQNPRTLMQRQGRFDRIGRNEPLVMYYLRDTSGALPLEQQVERLVSKAEALRNTGVLTD